MKLKARIAYSAASVIAAALMAQALTQEAYAELQGHDRRVYHFEHQPVHRAMEKRRGGEGQGAWLQYQNYREQFQSNGRGQPGPTGIGVRREGCRLHLVAHAERGRH